ncbi:MAG: acetate--CoA ligase family protein, partial [Phycisphaerales bacterium]|nr:acetate--CoA ligase family protein [Phycisphaerales bacterium]MCI0630671.1 acetate--CoA ligase family protein [Phycisphaerales bacterium]
MARLHEYQGKALLRQHGIATPRGEVASSPAEARQAAGRLGGATILKAQAWITGRKAKGAVVFADTPDDASAQASKLLAMTFGNFPVTEVLVEEKIAIKNELFVSISIDDQAQAPVMLLDWRGGSGIEDRAADVARLPIDVKSGINRFKLQDVVGKSGIDRSHHSSIVEAAVSLANIARQYEARSLEINPLAITVDGRMVAADCRMTIDDHAVFRHPELGIEIARELDHPPTELERIAYRVEQADHRGTFYFAQLSIETKGSAGVIGFHGAGGGGSMMSMDAATNAGFALANFCDTSGNPSAAKVYRAARIILSQPGLVGYFGSGSGVASQEQYHSAYGLAKAFIELKLDIPAVVRLGGNSEDRAVEILAAAAKLAGAPVEGYKKDDTPGFCAERLAKLVEKNWNRPWTPRKRQIPEFVGQGYSFPISSGGSGRVWIDHVRCDATTTAFVVEHSSGLLKSEDALPVLAVSEEEVAGKDSELVALEIECRRAGMRVVFVDLPIEGLDE